MYLSEQVPKAGRGVLHTFSSIVRYRLYLWGLLVSFSSRTFFHYENRRSRRSSPFHVLIRQPDDSLTSAHNRSRNWNLASRKRFVQPSANLVFALVIPFHYWSLLPWKGGVSRITSHLWHRWHCVSAGFITIYEQLASFCTVRSVIMIL